MLVILYLLVSHHTFMVGLWPIWLWNKCYSPKDTWYYRCDQNLSDHNVDILTLWLFKAEIQSSESHLECWLTLQSVAFDRFDITGKNHPTKATYTFIWKLNWSDMRCIRFLVHGEVMFCVLPVCIKLKFKFWSAGPTLSSTADQFASNVILKKSKESQLCYFNTFCENQYVHILIANILCNIVMLF